MSSIKNVVYRGVDGALKQVVTDVPKVLGPKQILVKITHSGLCASDLYAIPYHATLGHEGVGIVEAIGSEVTQFKVGDRAGGGYLRDSCGHCKFCLNGQDIWCHNRSIFIESDQSNGTIADYYIGIETFLHRIPESMSSEDAAPLQCAGATVYTALVDNIKPGQRVGILGIGGLGHLAIQFAKKLGAEVVVFSTTADKEQEAMGFGASEFVLASSPEKISKPVDVLVVTGSGNPDWSRFLNKDVITRRGILVPLSASDLNLPGLNMFYNGYTVKESMVATRAVHDDMLEFAARHTIKPTIEKFELSSSGLAAAIEKLKSGKMRYRAVLTAA
ncbi:hypothetical protein B7463_g4598, partial [Scytalidium lignicola]